MATIYRTIKNFHNIFELQYDLNSLMKWAKEWQLNIDFDNCLTNNFSHNIRYSTYHLNDIYLLKSDREKIWVVYVGNQFSFCQHVFYVLDKARKLCNLILRSFANSKPKSCSKST